MFFRQPQEQSWHLFLPLKHRIRLVLLLECSSLTTFTDLKQRMQAALLLQQAKQEKYNHRKFAQFEKK